MKLWRPVIDGNPRPARPPRVQREPPAFLWAGRTDLNGDGVWYAEQGLRNTACNGRNGDSVTTWRYSSANGVRRGAQVVAQPFVRVNGVLVTQSFTASKMRKTGAQQKRTFTELNLLRACQ